ncbi:hypothetical protein GGP41_002251 [Bipolaris sorokiniana]|nr:hypothetical protein GGP41_002251 [Bipolaris sorokiniana]
MKFSTVAFTIATFLATSTWAAPAETTASENKVSNMPEGISGAVVGPDGTFLAETSDDCGANSCHGFGGDDLCNDRCKHCRYKRGSCCGNLWQ